MEPVAAPFDVDDDGVVQQMAEQVPERMTLRTIFRETRSSRQIALIVLP